MQRPEVSLMRIRRRIELANQVPLAPLFHQVGISAGKDPPN